MITLEEVKLILGISGTQDDDRIEFFITLVEDEAKTHCNRETFGAGIKPTLALGVKDMLYPEQINGLQLESIGTYSYTKGKTIGVLSQGFYDGLAKWRVHYTI